MVDIVSNDAYSKFRQTQSPSFGTDKEVYSFYDSFNPSSKNFNPSSLVNPGGSIPNAAQQASGQSFSDTFLQGAALATAGAAMLMGGSTSMNPESWSEALRANAPAPASPNLIKKGIKVVKKAAPKIDDAVNVMNAQLSGALQAAEALGGQALQNATILAAEFGSPGSVPGMLDFGAEMAGMEGTIPGTSTGALEAELAAEASSELAATNADIAAREALAELEANLATELASEAAAPIELGTFEQSKLATEAGLEMEATQFQAVTDKAAEAALESISNIAPDLQLVTGEAAHNAVGAGTTALSGTAVTIPGAGTVSIELAQAGAKIAESIVGPAASAAALSTQMSATTAALALAETELAVSVAAGGTQAVLPTVTGAAAGTAGTAALTFAAAAPMVIPAVLMAIPMFFGSKPSRQTWNSMFRVGDDNKISHEIQGVSKFDPKYAEMGENWFIDVINNAIDAGNIEWNENVIGPENGKQLGDFGWQPGHGMTGTAGEASPWFVNHADLPNGYKNENPGTYFESEAEAAKMWLYVNAKAGNMKSGDVQKAFDAIDAFESLSVDRGYNDYKLGSVTEQRGVDTSQAAPGDSGVARDTYEAGYRQVAGNSGLADKVVKLTPKELENEGDMLARAVKYRDANMNNSRIRSRGLAVGESVDNFYVLSTTKERDVGHWTESYEVEPYMVAVSKLGELNDHGDPIGPRLTRSHFTFLPDSSESTPKPTPPKAEPKPTPKPTVELTPKAKAGIPSPSNSKPYVEGDPIAYTPENPPPLTVSPIPIEEFKKVEPAYGSDAYYAKWGYHRKGGKIGESKDSKKKIPASGLELPVTGGKAKPNSMTDDVPRTARSGDFVVNAKTVELMGVPFFRKLVRSAVSKASKKGMKVSKTSVSKKEGVDILVQNGEIRIPRELVKIIGLKKLRAWNNTGLRARGESPIAA